MSATLLHIFRSLPEPIYRILFELLRRILLYAQRLSPFAQGEAFAAATLQPDRHRSGARCEAGDVP